MSAFAKCNMCGKQINKGDTYYKCTVSTCNRKRMPLRFCSPRCWDAHLPTVRHRDPAYTEHIAGRDDD